jgi:ketosteroid isomerase-like protein
MNEKQNIELVQRMYLAFARGDIQTILDSLTPDVEWIAEGPEIIPYAGKRVGPSQTMDFFRELATTQADMKLTMKEFVAQGDQVASLGRYAGKVTATGKTFDVVVAHFFTVRNGKVSRFVNVTDTAAVADAYGASAAAAR